MQGLEAYRGVADGRRGGGAVVAADGQPTTLGVPADAEARYQSTYQRWWADPRLDQSGKDQTLGTVFTHDHFGPSNIQQHGFYSALIVEPKKSRWRNPDGTSMAKLGADGSGAAVAALRQCVAALGDAPARPKEHGARIPKDPFAKNADRESRD